MTALARDRAWLRSFLNLGARAARDGVPADDVERQEDTVLRALAMLDERPGVVLADEVGMGKTYEALGLVAAIRHEKPKARVLILTPGPDLNTKWHDELRRFGEGEPTVHSDFRGRFRAVRHLRQFVEATNEARIVIAPVTIFNTARGAGIQTYLLSLYFHWKRQTADLHGQTINAILRRFRDGTSDRVDVTRAKFLGYAGLDQIEKHLKSAFTAPANAHAITLDSIFEQEGLAGFKNKHAMRRAFNHARFQLLRRLIPKFDLLVLDEAHKLKNANTVRVRAVEAVFGKRFERAVFLTATPFQLDVAELRQVFRLFSLARTAPETMHDEVESLFADIHAYQDAYRAFERTWRQTDPATAAEFAHLYAERPELDRDFDDPSHQAVANRIRTLRRLKGEQVEPKFRSWMIRSLRENKRTYRRHVQHRQVPEGPGVLPFLLYERFIAELFRRGQSTHKVAVEINMASSFGAARTGALLDGEDVTRFDGELADYQALLRSMLDDLDQRHEAHPKTRFVVADTLGAAERGEKTLVFCARVATLSGLARDLKLAWAKRVEDRWLEGLPGQERQAIFGSIHPRLQKRFHNTRDALYLALREPYCQTLLYFGPWGLEHADEITRRANETLRGVRTIKSSADKLDYQIAKRCVEHAAAKLFRERHPDAADYEQALARLTHADYVPFGLDLEKDELEGDHVGDHIPAWTISQDVAERILSPAPSLWSFLSGPLDALMTAEHAEEGPWSQRVKLVEQLARYLTLQDMLFLPDLLTSAVGDGVGTDPIPSHALFDHFSTFWKSPPGRAWITQLSDFLWYFAHRDLRERHDVLDVLLAKPKFVSQTRDGDSRERLRRAFNTPLYPMILIANEVMQEGLDLHRSCARVIHHDLAWNPAQLEQRVGRVDRIGSLTAKRRQKDDDARLDILYPLVARTVDERMYRVVKMREKWLEFLLGAPPDFDAYSFDETPPPALPEGLAEELRIDLRPAQRRS
jgi:Helicase conserved C-terminal domain/SNF2-related domain